MMPTHPAFHKELAAVSLLIAIPQMIASPVMAVISHLVKSGNIVLELREVLDFFVISFPLTISISILFVLLEQGKLYPVVLLLVVAGAALLSNLLHYLISEIPFIHIEQAFAEPPNTELHTGGIVQLLRMVGKVFSIYWKQFGAVLFIQSVCIGLYAGFIYVKRSRIRN